MIWLWTMRVLTIATAISAIGQIGLYHWQLYIAIFKPVAFLDILYWVGFAFIQAAAMSFFDYRRKERS